MAGTTQIQASPGALVAIGIAKEAVWGTPVSPTSYLNAISFDPAPKNKLIPRQGVRKTIGTTNMGPGQFDCSGSLEVEFDCSNDAPLLAFSLGSDAVTGLGGGTFQHTMTLSTPRDSFCLSSDLGQNVTHQWAGCKTDQLDITAKAGAYLSLKASWVGFSDVPLGSTSLSPTYNTVFPLEHEYITSALLNGNTVPFDNFSVTIKTGMKPFWGATSGRFPRAVMETMTTVTGSFSVQMENETFNQILYGVANNSGPTSGTIAALPLFVQWTSPQLTAGGPPYSLSLNLPSIQLSDETYSIKRGDTVTTTFKFTASESTPGAQNDISAVLVNSTTGKYT